MRKLKQTEVAEFFDVSDRLIRDWDKAGCPSHKVGKLKHYISSEVHGWLLQRAKDAASEDLPLDVNDEEIRIAQRAQVIAKAEREQATTEMAILELARKLGDVVPRHVAAGVLSDATSEMRQALEVIPLRYSAEVLACKTLGEVKEVLQRAVSEGMAAISRIEIKDEDDSSAHE